MTTTTTETKNQYLHIRLYAAPRMFLCQHGHPHFQGPEIRPYGGITVAYRITDGVIRLAVARCSTKDNYSHKKGRLIAENRLNAFKGQYCAEVKLSYPNAKRFEKLVEVNYLAQQLALGKSDVTLDEALESVRQAKEQQSAVHDLKGEAVSMLMQKLGVLLAPDEAPPEKIVVH